MIGCAPKTCANQISSVATLGERAPIGLHVYMLPKIWLWRHVVSTPRLPGALGIWATNKEWKLGDF